MNIDSEKLKYLLNDMDFVIGEKIDKVLSDSQTDPHYSAVFVTNKIKCYIQVMTELGETLPYHNVKEFFEFNAYTPEEYRIFEEKRKQETVFYIGTQY